MFILNYYCKQAQLLRYGIWTNYQHVNESLIKCKENKEKIG